MANGKYDPGYSFRSSDFRSQPDRWQQKPVTDDEGKQACSSGTWCHAATRTDDGTWKPALTFQAYCPACRSRIAACLEDLPFAVVRLLAQIGERPRTGKAVRMPAGPREPIRLEIDALVREMALVLGSWHERVADVARLSAPEVKGVITHPAETVRDAQRVLSAHLDALLALPPEPMARVLFRPQTADDPEWDGAHGRVGPSGEAFMLPELGGAAAGREILDLHRHARSILGEVRARPEAFDGIPCRECEQIALERAEPPSDPERPAMHSRCASCADVMTLEEFTQWVTRYKSWAEAVPGLVCRRCQKGACATCSWLACSCRAAGHAKDTAA